MTQEITSTSTMSLGADANITEDASAIAAAIVQAAEESRELGGHDQEIERIAVEFDFERNIGGWPIARSVSVRVRSRLT